MNIKRKKLVRTFLSGILGVMLVFGAVSVVMPLELRAAIKQEQFSATFDTTTTGYHPQFYADNGDAVEVTCTVTNNTGGSLFLKIETNTRVNISMAEGTEIANGTTATIIVTFNPMSRGNLYQADLKFYTNSSFTGIYYTVDLHQAYRASGGGGTPATAKERTVPAHSHSFLWETSREATQDHDGEMIYVCSVCGVVEQRIPITGYHLFQKEVMDKIKAASPGATVNVKTGKWISFHKMVMNALAERNDVTLTVSFLEGEYKGDRLKFTIPAGTDTNALLNEEGYVGFKYLGGLFGLEKE